MTIYVNDPFDGGDPHYDELTLDTVSRAGEIGLRRVSTPKELDHLDKLDRKASRAIQASLDFLDSYQRVDSALVKEASKRNKEYQYYREWLFSQHPELDGDVSRSQLDISAPGKIGKVLSLPSMEAAAAMRMLMNTRSGYFEGVEEINGSGLDHRFETKFSKNGGLPFLPFDDSIDDTVSTLHFLNKEAHPLYDETVFIYRETIIKRARELLMGQSSDFALYIKDEKGHLVTQVTRADVGMDRDGVIDPHFSKKETDAVSVLPLIEKEKIVSRITGITAGEAKSLMVQNPDLDHIAITDESLRVQNIFTRTRVRHALKNKPFLINGGLGAAVAIGVGKHSQTMDRAFAAVEAGAVFLQLETAHANRRDVFRIFKEQLLTPFVYGQLKQDEIDRIKNNKGFIKKLVKELKKKFKDQPLIFGYGTVISPEAVALLAALGIDIVKIGIGGGGQCSTFDVTGVGGLPPGHFIRCGRMAKALGIQIMTDGGLNSRRRMATVSTMDGVGLNQFGTWLVPTVDSASPPIWDGKEWKKRSFGEASGHAVKNRRIERGEDDGFESEDEIHSEGKDTWVHMAKGRNATAGGILLNIGDAKRSNISYEDVNDMDDAQNFSRIRRITKATTTPG